VLLILEEEEEVVRLHVVDDIVVVVVVVVFLIRSIGDVNADVFVVVVDDRAPHSNRIRISGTLRYATFIV
jgi:uncharacterized membrane protein